MSFYHIQKNIRVEYWRWFSNDQGENPGTDKFKFYISNNGGNDWLLLESNSQSNTSWNKIEFQLDKYIVFTQEMQFKFTVEDIVQDEDLTMDTHLVSQMSISTMICFLSLYYAFIATCVFYFIQKLPERYPYLLPGISRDKINISSFQKYKSIIYPIISIASIVIVCIIIFELIRYEMIIDPIHVLFIIILFIITLLTISSEDLKLMGRSMISNDIKMDIEDIKSAMENFFSLKKLLIFFAITIQFLGTVYCLGLLGLNPALDIVHGIDFVFPLAKASFFISDNQFRHSSFEGITGFSQSAEKTLNDIKKVIVKKRNLVKLICI